MRLVDAVYLRITDLIATRGITLYALSALSGLPYSTIATMKLSRPVKLSTIYGICEGLEITLKEFFSSPLFEREKIID